MAAAKKTTSKLMAEEVVELEVSTPDEAPVEDEVVVAKVAPVTVAPTTAPFTARNTWTAYYGTNRYDFVEGRTYDLPVGVASWFNRTSH